MVLIDSQTKLHRVRGFSLIELLVVTAVLGVLIGISVLVAGSVRKSTRTSQGSNNLRQLFMAQMQYVADHGGLLAPVYLNGQTHPWMCNLAPYLYPSELSGKNDNEIIAFRLSRWTAFDMPGADRGSVASPRRSIGVNWCISPYGSAGSQYRLAVWPRPSQTIIMGEMRESNNDVVNAPDVSYPSSPVGFRQPGEKALMLFGDGHVQAMSRSELNFNGKTTESNPWCWW